MMTLVAWGANSHGQLGLGTVSEQEGVPVEVPVGELSTGNVAIIVGGGGHTLLADKEGRLYATGWNNAGQLGLGHKEEVYSFTQVDLKIRVAQLAAGWDFSFVISDSGFVYASGSNSFGQLGVGDTSLKSVEKFVQVIGLREIKSISAGLRHAGCVDKAGKVYMWGAGSKGQLGLGDKRRIQWDPIEVPNLLQNAIDISCGQYFTLILTHVGVIGFGDNKFGQVVSGGPSFFLEAVESLNEIADRLSCGWTHSLTFREGRVKTWGRNNYFQLGRVDSDETEVVSSISKALSGSEHCVCLTENGDVLCWGWNEHGNCGVGSDITDNIKIPTKVCLKDEVKAVDIFVGSAHCFALLEHL